MSEEDGELDDENDDEDFESEEDDEDGDEQFSPVATISPVIRVLMIGDICVYST